LRYIIELVNIAAWCDVTKVNAVHF